MFKSCPILRFIKFCDAFRSSIEHYQAVVRYYANYKQATKTYCVVKGVAK